MAESKEELKSLLMRVKEESEKAGLKLNIQKTKTMTSSPITSWQVSEVSESRSAVSLFVTPWTVAYQAPLFMGFSRQEYWNGWPFPSPGDLPNPGIEPRPLTRQADSLLSEPPGKSWLIREMGIKRVTQTPLNHCNDLTAHVIYCTQIARKAMTRYSNDFGRWKWGKGSQGGLVNLAPSYPIKVFPLPRSMAVSVCMCAHVRGRNFMQTW